MKRRAAALAALGVLGGCAELVVPVPSASPAPSPPPAPPAPEGPPPPPREFRAAWVATVANIDWPSAPGLPAEQQRSEALAILERARSLGLNALILQVRPAGDAIFPSTLEPWSEYLSGEQGKAPGYDPLAFWIEQAHRRGLELHAWFNPYRARAAAAKSPLVLPHLALRRPALVKRYADMLWMDPGEPAAAEHMLAVVADLLRRYDVDGVHIDDYFYPYPVPGKDGVDQPFPDDEAWARYQLGGGPLVRDDWRRQNVDTLVQAMQRTVRQIKPQVRFGISPFGIGRPDRRPPGITGFSQYDKLYADVEKWLASGWLDYLVPQLYWPINREGQQFPVLLDYWLAENAKPQRHLWPGLFTSQIVKPGDTPGPRAWPAQEIAEQVLQQRARATATGHVHFSMAALMQDRDGIVNKLRQLYAQPALVPATPWLDATVAPATRLRRSDARVQWDGATPWLWAVWRRQGGEWRFTVLPGSERIIEAPAAASVAVAAVSRTGVLGAVAQLSTP